MRWRDLARRLEEQPGFRAAYEEQFPYANVALAVVALRARHELTQRDLAERVGTPQPVIARLESGKHPVEIRLLSRIAAAVGETWMVAFDDGRADAEPARQGSGDDLLDAFNDANTSGDFETASLIAAEIARDPSTPRRRLALALDAYNRRDHATAERWGRDALAADDLPDPSKEVAILVVGRSILSQERPKEALRVLRPLRSPKFIGWLRDAAMAEAHLEADQPDKAQEAVDRVLASADVPEAHYLAARILWHRDLMWPALEHVVFFRAAQPDDPSGLMLHGSILGFLGDAKAYPGAHEAALDLFARVAANGDCEAIRLHGVTSARIGRWREALADAQAMMGSADGHDAEGHRSAVESIVVDVFSHMPDDVEWAEPTAIAAGLLGDDHDLVRLQRALVEALAGDVDAAAASLEVDLPHVEDAPVERQMVIAAGLLASGRSAEATAILARNIEELTVPDGLIRLAGSALEVDDTVTAKAALDRIGETTGTTADVAAIASRLLVALVRANEAASVTGTLVGDIAWKDLVRPEQRAGASTSTWEGRHAPASVVMDRMTRAFLH